MAYKIKKVNKGKKIYPAPYSMKTKKKYRSLDYITPKGFKFERIEGDVIIFKRKENEK